TQPRCPVAMHEGPKIGLQLVENLGKKNELDADYLFHAAKADLLRRMGDSHNTKAPYHQAISL
ncbi:MAG: RNA polymerase subunit sigma-24, partial [Dehalococcoidia bacterium]